MRNDVLLSIVIANYNYGHFLKAAINSVTCQCGKPVKCDDGIIRLPIVEGVFVELIICDAKSSDNSVKVIMSHEDELTWWCSEPDNGQSAAFNKGFAHSTGRFLTWLNADDVLIFGALKRLLDATRQFPTQEWFAGGSVHFGPNERIILCTRTRRFSTYAAQHGQISVYAPSSFFSHRLYNSVNGVDEFFQYSMDTHLWAKFYMQAGMKFIVLPCYMFGFRYHAESKTTCVHFRQDKSCDDVQQGDNQGTQERARIRAIFPPHKPMTWWGRWLHMDWVAKAISLWDTMRYRGRYLHECGFLKKAL